MIVLWVGISSIYIYNLNRSNNKSDTKFLYILLVIILYPFYVYIITCIEIYKTSNIVGLGPEYPICNTTYNGLTSSEKHAGIIGKLNNKCTKTQQSFLRNKATTIQRRGLMTIKILFTLIIFLFGFGKTSSFHYKLITKNSYFIRSLIQVACITGIITLTVKFFGVDFYYISNILDTVYNAIFVISVTTLIILILYLLHNFIINFKKNK